MAKRKKTKPSCRGAEDILVLQRIEEICLKYNCSAEEIKEIVLLALSPPPKPLSSMTIPELKLAVAKSWNKESYELLTKDIDWKTYHEMNELNARLRTTWMQYYREWVCLPVEEGNLKKGYGIINGVDIFKNFRPWEVFNIDKKTGTKEQIQLAFKKLSFKYHPDIAGKYSDSRIFSKLLEMRDSLLIIFK